LAQIEFNILHKDEEAFSSNLTYTTNDFSNCFHQDNDFNSYTFGIWAPIAFDNGNLISQKSGFECEGGQFLLGFYKVCVDLNFCDEIVEILWRSNLNSH